MSKKQAADGPKGVLGLQDVYIPNFFSDLEYAAETMEFENVVALAEADDKKVV